MAIYPFMKRFTYWPQTVLGLAFSWGALMGWPATVTPFNWREADLLGRIPDRTAQIARRPQCPVCGPFCEEKR